MIELFQIPQLYLKEYLAVDTMYGTVYTDGDKSLDDADIPYNYTNIWLTICYTSCYTEFTAPVGIIYLRAIDTSLFEIHFGLYKCCRGAHKTISITKDTLMLLQKLYGCDTEFITHIDKSHTAAYKLAKKMGFTELHTTANKHIMIRKVS